MPLFPNDYTLDSSRVHFVSRGVREMTALGVSPTNTSPLSMIMERQESSDNSPTPIARPSSKQIAPLRRATKDALNAPDDRIPSLVPLPLPSTFSDAMHAAIEQQSRSHSAGVHAERYLRGAVALFEHALSLKITSGPASLRLAAAQYQLSSHCRSHDAVAHLRSARSRLMMDDSVASKEALATVCGRLCELTRHPGDTLWGSESGGYASEALDALEDVAAGRMDRASALTKSAFERETPTLATTFLALAEAAATVCTLSPDLETADAYAELADHALSHAANMASMSRARVLITHVQLTSARLAAERLKFYSSRGEEGGWDDLVFELGVLAAQSRDRARRLRGTRGAVAADQAATAIKLLADTRVMYAASLGIEHPLSPDSALSSRSAPTTPAASVFGSPFGSHVTPPGLEHSKGSWSSSDHSPPIPEEDEEREELEELQDPNEEDAARVAFLSPPSMSTASAVKGKRAPPPPPLMLHVHELHTSPPLLPHRPGVLSPLNPARRASEMPVRSPLAHAAAVASPRRATWMGSSTPVSPAARTTPNSGSRRLPQSPPLSVAQLRWNSLAAATKGYKLALSLLSGANLPQGERASRKSDLLFAIAATALARAELARASASHSKPVRSQDSSNTGSYFSPTAAHASPDSIRSLRLPPAVAVPQIHVRQHGPGATTRLSPSLPLFNHHLTTPPTPRDDPRSHTRTTGAAALRATAEIYAAWAAREVGWSAVIDPKGAGADRRTGTASADEAGVRAVLLAVRVWWIRSHAGDDVDGSSEDIDEGDWTSDAEDGVSSGEHSGRGSLAQSRAEETLEKELDNRTPTGPAPPIGEVIRALAADALGATGSDAQVVSFGLPFSATRRVSETLRRLRREGTGPDDVRRFVANLAKPLPPVESRFWHSVEVALE